MKIGDLVRHIMAFENKVFLVLRVSERGPTEGTWLKLLAPDGEIFHTYNDNYEVVNSANR